MKNGRRNKFRFRRPFFVFFLLFQESRRESVEKNTFYVKIEFAEQKNTRILNQNIVSTFIITLIIIEFRNENENENEF